MRANVIAAVAGVRRYGFGILDHEHRYGEPGVHTVITADGYHHGVPVAQIEPLPEPVEVPDVKPTLRYRVREPYQVFRDWETASNYDRYEVLPGDYPIEWVDISYRPAADGKAYYGRYVVDAIHRQRHYVNRLFTASSVVDEYPGKRTTLPTSTYAYALTPGLVCADGKAQVVQVDAAHGEVFPAAAAAGGRAES